MDVFILVISYSDLNTIVTGRDIYGLGYPNPKPTKQTSFCYFIIGYTYIYLNETLTFSSIWKKYESFENVTKPQPFNTEIKQGQSAIITSKFFICFNINET